MAVNDLQVGDDRAIGRMVVRAFGRKTRDQVRADGDIGSQFTQPDDEVYGIAAQVAALHALEDKVVPVLQRQVQVRHQP